MMRLFNYRTDTKDNIFPEKIYADNLENSLTKWIDLINNSDSLGQFYAELKSLVNESKVSSFKKLDGTENTYYFVFTSDKSHRTVYVDSVDIQPDFIADLEYWTTENGGRIGFAASGYRPQIRFSFSNNMTSGEQVFWDKDKVYPGEKTRAQIRILDHITFRHTLSADTTFELCEGDRVIGSGKIIEVNNEELKASRYQ